MDALERAALREPALDPSAVGLGGGRDLARPEEERHVHADPLGDQGLDGRDAVRRARHLHEEVGTADGLPVVPSLRDRGPGVVRDVGRHLQAHESIPAAAAPVAVGEQIRRARDVAHGQLLVDLLGRAARRREPANLIGVGIRSPPMAFLKMVGFEVTP